MLAGIRSPSPQTFARPQNSMQVSVSMCFAVCHYPELVRTARTVDVVHTNGHSMLAHVVASTANRPLVVTHQGYQAACLIGLGWHDGERCGYSLRRCTELTARQRGVAFAARQLTRHGFARASLPLAAAHVAVSQFVQAKIDAPRSTIVYNCADTSVFTPEGATTGREPYLFVGRFVAEKGVDVLLRAVALCAHRGTPVTLDLVGSGPLEERFRRLVSDLNIDQYVQFRGRMHGAALATAIRKCRAVVVPSTWDEAFGIVAAEAISCGRLALVSDTGGLPEVVEGTECTVPAGDEEAWARALARLQADRRWREEMESRLPTIAARFTESHFAESYIAIYERVLRAR